MIKYVFGVMSNKWSLIAPDTKTAYATMVLFIQKNVPIAVYESAPYGISPKSFMENNPDAFDAKKIKVCFLSIKEETI